MQEQTTTSESNQATTTSISDEEEEEESGLIQLHSFELPFAAQAGTVRIPGAARTATRYFEISQGRVNSISMNPETGVVFIELANRHTLVVSPAGVGVLAKEGEQHRDLTTEDVKGSRSQKKGQAQKKKRSILDPGKLGKRRGIPK